MLRASLGKVVHTVQRAGTFAAKVSPQELHKIAVHVRAVVYNHKIYHVLSVNYFFACSVPGLAASLFNLFFGKNKLTHYNKYVYFYLQSMIKKNLLGLLG